MITDAILKPCRRSDLVVDRADAHGTAAAAVFNTQRTYRYLLTRQWAAGPTAVIIGTNPSVAGAWVNDPTTRRCSGLASRQRCGSIALVNLFALSSTNPAWLRRHPDPVGEYNDEFLRHVTAGQSLVIAAWGIHGALGGRAARVLADLHNAGVDVMCWGSTRHGHPRHPLYVRNDAPLRPYPCPPDQAQPSQSAGAAP